MIYIGICDDEEIQRQHILKLCEQFFTKYSLSFECIEFTSGEELLQYTGEQLHILFLDVELGGMDGIEVMHQVEEADWVWRIVFISSHEEMVWNSFGIKTLGFVRKPVEYATLEKWIKIAIKENQENRVYECTVGREKYYKKIEDIYYLESEGNYTYICEKKEKILINDNLKCWQKKMENAPMVRIHKSYLINMQHIKAWEADTVVLSNETVLPLGRQYKNNASETYFAFVKRQVKGRM